MDSSNSSTSVAPDCDSSSGDKVIVDYSKLKRKKDFEISPTVERRRHGISEASFQSVARKKITFAPPQSQESCTTPKGAETSQDEITILDSSPDESLEIVYQDIKTAEPSTNLQPLPVSSQEISLFLSEDTQRTQSQMLSCKSSADVENTPVSLPSSENSLLCHDTLKSSEDDSQIPAGTINPTQVATILSKVKSPLHSQAPDVSSLMDRPLKDGKEGDKSSEREGSKTSASVSPEEDERLSEQPSQKEKIVKTSPKKAKNEGHQSLLEYSQISSSESSTTSSAPSSNSSAPVIETDKTDISEDCEELSISSLSLETAKITVPEIPLSELSSSLHQCSGTIVAKASKTAKENIEIARKMLENKAQSAAINASQTDSFMSQDDDKVKPISSPPTKTPGSPSKIHSTPVSSKEICQKSSISVESDKNPLNPHDTPSPNLSLSNSPAVGRGKGRKTSTPTAEHLSQGVSPNMSGAAGSYIENNVNAESDSSKSKDSAPLEEMVEECPSIERSTSSKSTLEIPHNYLSLDDSLTSIDEVKAKGYISKETFHVKVTMWKDPSTNDYVYSLLKGEDEELIVKSLPFKKQLKKSGSSSTSSDRRLSDISSFTSSSSGYHADKSSSSSSCSRRTSMMSQGEVLKRGRESLDSVQVLPLARSSDKRSGDDDDDFLPPAPMPLRTKSPKVVSFPPGYVSSSGDEAPKTPLGYGSFKARKGKRATPKSLMKSIIKEEQELPTVDSESQAESHSDVVDLIDEIEHLSSKKSSLNKTEMEMKVSKTGIVNKGLHYDTFKFFEDLSGVTIDILKSVPLSEEETDIFLKDNAGMSSLDVSEEQARMVINRMINVKLCPQSLVFAKYHDHYYSAIIESENAGGWNIKYTLDGFQKFCPLEQILPIDLLPRNQKCFRRYQGCGNSKSIVSVMVTIIGHTVVNGAVLHIASDSNKTFNVPHSHLSLQMTDAQRYINAWNTTQSITKSGPDLSLDNVVAGKRRRTPVIGSPISQTGSPASTSRTRLIRKKKPDPSLDSSLTEAEVTVDEDVESQENPRKKQRAISEDLESRPSSPAVHNRVTEIVSEEGNISETDSPTSKSQAKTRTPKRKSQPAASSSKSPANVARKRKSEPVINSEDKDSDMESVSGASVSKNRKVKNKATKVLDLDSDAEQLEESKKTPAKGKKKGKLATATPDTSSAVQEKTVKASDPVTPSKSSSLSAKKRGRPTSKDNFRNVYAIHKHSCRSQHIYVLTTCNLCFDKFASLNIRSLMQHRGCIVVPFRVDI